MGFNLSAVNGTSAADYAAAVEVQPATGISASASAQAGSTIASSEAAGTQASLPEDHATLSAAPSSQDRSLESLSVEIIATAATRSSRIETLRNAVASGQYSVDAEAVAQAMVEESF